MLGVVLGVGLGLYIDRVGRLVPLTVLALALVSAEFARQSWVEHLLVCMAAGFTARNLFPEVAGRFLDGLEQSSTPIYVLFFALVGAGLGYAVGGSWKSAAIGAAATATAARAHAAVKIDIVTIAAIATGGHQVEIISKGSCLDKDRTSTAATSTASRSSSSSSPRGAHPPATAATLRPAAPARRTNG